MNTNLVNQTAQEIREIQELLKILVNSRQFHQHKDLYRTLTDSLEKKQEFVRMNLMQD